MDEGAWSMHGLGCGDEVWMEPDATVGTVNAAGVDLTSMRTEARAPSQRGPWLLTITY